MLGLHDYIDDGCYKIIMIKLIGKISSPAGISSLSEFQWDNNPRYQPKIRNVYNAM